MKKIVWLWSIWLFLSGMLFASELVWEKDTDTAFAKAKAERKNVMLMMEASGCKWCKKMESTTLADEEVKKRLQNYLLVKILRCDKEAMKILPQSSYPAPSVFFMTPDKEILEQSFGYFEAEDFIATIDEVEEK